MTTKWLIERKDAQLCYSRDASSCRTWVTFTDPAAWRFDTQSDAEAVIAARDLTNVVAVNHKWVLTHALTPEEARDVDLVDEEATGELHRILDAKRGA